jgi:hypothetical protein
MQENYLVKIIFYQIICIIYEFLKLKHYRFLHVLNPRSRYKRQVVRVPVENPELQSRLPRVQGESTGPALLVHRFGV